jgi:hypothetical protein
LYALLHAQQTETAASGGGVKTDAVVAHENADAVFVGLQRHQDVFCSCVPRAVRQGFLYDPVDAGPLCVAQMI